MATAPAISFLTDAKLTAITTDKFSYTLWANDKVFIDWAKWALDTNNKSVTTTNQRDNAGKYSGYALKIFCDTTTVSQSPAAVPAGCCMSDAKTA